MIEVYNISKSDDFYRYYRVVEGTLRYAFNNGKMLCKLYSCNAEIWECMGNLVLVSYDTPIAVYAFNSTLYDCLRVVYGYTATSSQHISKFKKWLAENNHPVLHFVRFKN